MQRRRKMSEPKGERGVVIILVAIVLLFVVGAMAVLAIDVVTFYTARSEAQLAADGAALAGARVMANSGSTSSGSAPVELLAQAVARSTATQVAAQNKVGGRNLNPATEVSVSFPATVGLGYNPRVQVQITRNDLPTFFARIFGRTQVTVSATAIAEAYNPSGANISLGAGGRIAPACVKPWLLPNMDPGTGAPMFDPSGSILTNGLNEDWMLTARCGDCSPGGGGIPNAAAGQYYPGAIDVDDFPVPTQSLPMGTAGFNDYQLAVAGCVQKPIACGAGANINIDTNSYSGSPTRDADTVQAAKILIHDNGAVGDSDRIDPIAVPIPPFQFVAGNANPIASAIGQNVLVSDSLVTVPVFDSTLGVNPQVQVIGFLQLFLNRDGTPLVGNQIKATIVNMAGCGNAATGQPVLGTGTSAIPVRLVAQ